MPSTRQLAAILFADIAGYTALMQRNEQDALLKLARFRESLERKTSEFEGTIIQYYGDGCLIMFQSPVEAIGFAIALQHEFRLEPVIPVRIGIHTGDVVLKDGFMFGDAVNITSRIESMGTGGSVLLSEITRNQVKNKPELQVISLGKFKFKNVEDPMEVFALTNDNLPIPKREEMEGKSRSLEPGAHKYSLRYIILIIASLLLFGYVALMLWQKQNKSFTGGSHTEKSIAILPLRNLSGDQRQDYFAEGVVEAIYTKLAQVANLRVTSMTSMLGYQNEPKSIMEIAKELKVNHILEGSVSRNKDKVRIIVRLVDATHDRQLWTQTYDRQLTDIFAIQSNIAQAVVTALETTLSPDEQNRISSLEVADISAYDLYLSGRTDFHEYKSTLDTAFNESALRKARESIQLDPHFDDAFVLLANCWYTRKDYGFGTIVFDSADHYIDHALRINPSNSDALCGKGNIEWERANYEKSRQLAQKALDISPNNGSALRLLASFYMYESESVEKSIPLLVKAITLDPKNQDRHEGNLSLYLNLGSIYLRADLLNEAEALYLKALDISPGRKSLEAITQLGYLYHISGKFDQCIVYRKQQLELTPEDFGAINEYAGAHYAAGHLEEAELYYRKLLDQINKGYRESFRSYIFRHRLAHILLLTGREKEASKLFDEHLKNEMGDLASGTRHFGQEYAIAGAYAAMGDKENAYEWLDKMPFWYVTYQFMRVDPLFKSLRDEEHYKQIMHAQSEKIQRLQSSIRTLEADGQLQIMLHPKE